MSYGDGYVTSQPPRLTQLLCAALQDACVDTSWTQPTGFTKSYPDGQRIVGNTEGTTLGLLEGLTDGDILGDSDGTHDGLEDGALLGVADGETVAPDKLG